MTTPNFILELRQQVGHKLLWLIGITAYVQREDGRILLGRRADSGKWALVSGINEPGEQPADTTVREVKEETGVDITVTDLVGIKSSQNVIICKNGDETQYMDIFFLCKPDPSGNKEPFVGDDESLEVGWFSPAQLPEPLAESTVERLNIVQQYLDNAKGGDTHALFYGGLSDCNNSEPPTAEK